MQDDLNRFILGAIVMACIVAGMFFVRFWRATRDRLFIMFAIAFWIMSLNWASLAFVSEQNEARPALYILRLLAFVLILFAIFDKNRARRMSR
jgi:Ca2+/Na+ antiporter